MLASARLALRGVTGFARTTTGATQYATFRVLSNGADGNDTHDDFKPKFKEPPATHAGSLEDDIKADVSSKKVFLYMKGDPAAPMCGFSNMACRILDAYGVEYGSRNVLADPELREGIKKFTEWPTIPQIFVNGEFVGGSDILMSMHQSGELEKLFWGDKGTKGEAS